MMAMRKSLVLAALVLAPLAGRAAPRPGPPLFGVHREGDFLELGSRRSEELRTSSDGADLSSEEWMLTEKLHLGIGGHVYHPRLVQYHLGGDLTLVQEFIHDDNSLLPGGAGNIEILPEHPVGATLFGNVMELQVNRTFARSYEVRSFGYGATVHSRYAVPVDVSYTHRESKAVGGNAKSTDPEVAAAPEADTRGDEIGASARYSVGGGKSFGQVQLTKDDEQVRDLQVHRLSALANHTTTFGDMPHRGLHVYANALNQRDATETTTFASSAHLDWGWLKELASQHALGFTYTQLHAPGGTDATGGQTAATQSVTGVDAQSSLRHQLYQSLTSTADMTGHLESASFGTTETGGGGIAEEYAKRLGQWGLLSLSAASHLDRTARQTTASSALAVDEPHSLAGPAPEPLLETDVDATTVHVTNEGGIPYVEGVDYTVAQRGHLTYLERLATGNIPPTARVLVDYQYQLPGATDVLVTSARFGASVAVLDLVTPYARYALAEPTRLGGDNRVQLDAVKDLVAGVRFGIPYFQADVQYEHSESTFSTFRGYLQSVTIFPTRHGDGFDVTINGSHAVFNYDAPAASLQRFTVGATAVVPITPRMSIHMDGNYQRERWNRDGLEDANALDAFGARTLLFWQFRAIDVEAGAQFSTVIRPISDEHEDLVYVRARRNF